MVEQITGAVSRSIIENALKKSPLSPDPACLMGLDLIIIGGGPGGLTAGIYAGRARLKTLLLEKLIHGGQMMTTDLVRITPASRRDNRLRAQ